jgi:hypothetical protein
MPSSVLVAGITFLCWSGVFSNSPDAAAGFKRVRGLTISEFGLLLWIVLMVGVLLQPLQFGLVQMLEGYWPARWPWLEARKSRSDVFRTRREQLKKDSIVGWDQKADERVRNRAGYAGWQLRQRYPLPESMMPTALGNVLRAAEERAGQRYGLDTVTMWPRLYPVIGERLGTVLADQRNQLDLAVRFCLVLATLGIVYLVSALVHAVGVIDLLNFSTFGRHLWQAWWLYAVSISGLLLSWLSYRGAISAAESYGISMEAAFDLHRFDLLVALHLPLPFSRATESLGNAELSDFLRRGQAWEPYDEPDFRYQHPREVRTPKPDQNSET